MQNNFFCPIVDIIAPPHPFRLMGTLQFLGHALNSFHLLHDGIQPFLCLFVQVCKICPQFSGQYQCVQSGWVDFSQIFPVHPSVLMCFPSLLMLAIIFVVIPAASLKSSFLISRSISVCQSGL